MAAREDKKKEGVEEEVVMKKPMAKTQSKATPKSTVKMNLKNRQSRSYHHMLTFCLKGGLCEAKARKAYAEVP